MFQAPNSNSFKGNRLSNLFFNGPDPVYALILFYQNLNES